MARIGLLRPLQLLLLLTTSHVSPTTCAEDISPQTTGPTHFIVPNLEHKLSPKDVRALVDTAGNAFERVAVTAKATAPAEPVRQESRGRRVQQAAAGRTCSALSVVYNGVAVSGLLLEDDGKVKQAPGPAACPLINSDAQYTDTPNPPVTLGFEGSECKAHPGCGYSDADDLKCSPMFYDLIYQEREATACSRTSIFCFRSNWNTRACLNTTVANINCCWPEWGRCRGVSKYATCSAVPLDSCERTVGCEVLDTSLTPASFKWVERADASYTGLISSELGASRVNFNLLLSFDPLYRHPDHPSSRSQLYFTRIGADTEEKCKSACAQKSSCGGYLFSKPTDLPQNPVCVLLPMGPKQYSNGAQTATLNQHYYLITDAIRQSAVQSKLVFKGPPTSTPDEIWANMNWARDVFIRAPVQVVGVMPSQAVVPWIKTDVIINDVCTTKVTSPEACLAQCVANKECRAWSTYVAPVTLRGQYDALLFNSAYGWLCPANSAQALQPGGTYCALLRFIPGGYTALQKPTALANANGMLPVGLAAGVLLHRYPTIAPFPNITIEADPIRALRTGVIADVVLPGGLINEGHWASSKTLESALYNYQGMSFTKETCEAVCQTMKSCTAFQYVRARRDDTAHELYRCVYLLNYQGAYTDPVAPAFKSMVVRFTSDIRTAVYNSGTGSTWKSLIFGEYYGDGLEAGRTLDQEIQGGLWRIMPDTGLYLPRTSQYKTLAEWDNNNFADVCVPAVSTFGSSSWASVIIPASIPCRATAQAASYTACRDRCRTTAGCTTWVFYQSFDYWLHGGAALGCTSTESRMVAYKNVCVMFRASPAVTQTNGQVYCTELNKPGAVMMGVLTERL